MFLAMVLSMTVGQSDILACHRDSHGKFVVSKEQWNFIHKELESKDSKRVLKLIHPSRNLSVRTVQTAYPEPDGSIKEYFEKWNRDTVIENLTQTNPPTFDYLHPGYTYDVACSLFPGQDFKSKESGGYSYRSIMKGDMLYEDLTRPKERKLTAKRRRSLQYLKRLSPISYLRVTCSEGRLWLSEISSDSAAE